MNDPHVGGDDQTGDGNDDDHRQSSTVKPLQSCPGNAPSWEHRSPSTTCKTAKDLSSGPAIGRRSEARYRVASLTREGGDCYTPEGGRIDLAVEMTLNDALLGVDDTGPGIPPEPRDRVLDPFHRLLGTDVIGSGRHVLMHFPV